MALGLAKTQGKGGRWWQMVKGNVGPCWKSLIQSELSRGSHKITQPCKERKIREHNTGITETRVARVEQNTRHTAEPSTLYQVYRCIKQLSNIVISQPVNVFQTRNNISMFQKGTNFIFTCS